MAKTPTTTAKPKAAPRPRKPKDPLAPATAAERGLLAAVKAEVAFDASALTKAQRVVRPALFRALLCGRIGDAKIGERGLSATRLIFKESLDLSHLRAGDSPLPRLMLNDTVFEQEVSFADSHLRSLYVMSSDVRRGLNLTRLKTQGDLWLDRTTCTDGVRLGGARIDGDVSLEGVKLKGSTDAAGHISGASLFADRLIVTGSVVCGSDDNCRFEAEGEVRLLGANISGDLILGGAKLKGATSPEGAVSGASLSADHLVVAGSVHCVNAGQHRFEAEGEVRFLGASIGGVLHLERAKLKGATGPDGEVSGPSLSADRVVVKGSIGLFHFEAEGEVRLLGATIGGVLSLVGAKLKGATNAKGKVSGPALSADRMIITGGMFCRANGQTRFEVDGEMRLLGAAIGGQLDLTGAKCMGTPYALSGERMSVGDAIFLRGGFEADGGVDFSGAELTDVVVHGTIKAGGRALNLSDAAMRRLSVALSAESRGEVVLEGATAETLEALEPSRWGSAPVKDTGVKLDLDGFTYRRAEVPPKKPEKGKVRWWAWEITSLVVGRERRWAKFWFPDPIAENVLDVLDRGFHGCSPGRDHYQPQPFEQAARVLRESGHGRAADDIAVAKREFERVCGATHLLSKYLFSPLHLFFFRYGYGPMRAGLWTAFFLFVGWAAYSLFQADGGGMFAVGPTSEPQPCSQAPFALALDVFLPLVDLHVEDKCRWGESYRWRGWAESFRILYSLIGLVFVPMVTLTFAGVLRKD